MSGPVTARAVARRNASSAWGYAGSVRGVAVEGVSIVLHVDDIRAIDGEVMRRRNRGEVASRAQVAAEGARAWMAAISGHAAAIDAEVARERAAGRTASRASVVAALIGLGLAALKEADEVGVLPAPAAPPLPVSHVTDAEFEAFRAELETLAPRTEATDAAMRAYVRQLATAGNTVREIAAETKLLPATVREILGEKGRGR